MAATTRATSDKAAGSVNPAELMTKELSMVDINKYIEMMRAKFAEGRPEFAVRVSDGAVGAPARCLCEGQDGDERVPGSRGMWVGPDLGYPSPLVANLRGFAGNHDPGIRGRSARVTGQDRHDGYHDRDCRWGR